MRASTPAPLPLLLAIGDKTHADADLRRLLYQTILQFPGLHPAELARQAGIGEAITRYHLHVMVRLGLVHELEERGYLRYYPPAKEATPMPLGRHEKAALALLRRPVPLRIVLGLLGEDGPRSMSWVAEQAGVSNGTATYHVKNLEQAELVLVTRRHRERLVSVRDPTWTTRLLVQYPPPRDVVEGFIELFDQLEI